MEYTKKNIFIVWTSIVIILTLIFLLIQYILWSSNNKIEVVSNKDLFNIVTESWSKNVDIINDDNIIANENTTWLSLTVNKNNINTKTIEKVTEKENQNNDVTYISNDEIKLDTYSQQTTLSIDVLKQKLLLKYNTINETVNSMSNWEKEIYYKKFLTNLWLENSQKINPNNYIWTVQTMLSYLYKNKEYKLLETILNSNDNDIINGNFLLQLQKKRRVYNQMLLTII